MTNEELYIHAKEQEPRMQAILETLCNTCLELDAQHENGAITSFYIDYDERDMLNAITIFYHVASNYASKHGYLTAENTVEKISNFRDMIKDTFGLDSIQEMKIKVMLDSIKNTTTHESKD